MGLVSRVVKRLVVGDEKCSKHGTSIANGKACDKCARGQVPGQRGRRAVATRPGQTKQTGHQPYACPVTGCGGTVRGGICPRSDFHR